MKKEFLIILIIVLAVAGYVVFKFVGKDIEIIRPGEISPFPTAANSIEAIKIKVFFGNSKFDPSGMNCDKVYPVERNIQKTLAVAKAAAEELLKGPAQQEKEQGYFTSINSNVAINSLELKDGTAKIDFDEQLEFQVGGSCRVAAIRKQITETLKQFSEKKEVLISINGRTEDILQP